MKAIEIIINGEAYPCSPTMGAMLRFKEQTGREITEIKADSFSDLCTYLWCCAAAGAKRAGKSFDMTLMDFADNVTPEDMTAWTQTVMQPDTDADGQTCEKKSQ